MDVPFRIQGTQDSLAVADVLFEKGCRIENRLLSHLTGRSDQSEVDRLWRGAAAARRAIEMAAIEVDMETAETTEPGDDHDGGGWRVWDENFIQVGLSLNTVTLARKSAQLLHFSPNLDAFLCSSSPP